MAKSGDDTEKFVREQIMSNACLCERPKRPHFVFCWGCERELSIGVKSKLISNKRAKNWPRLSEAMDEAVEELQEAGRL
jgi:hypothetical protein